MSRPPIRDESLSLLKEGYAFLSTRRRQAHSDVVSLRLLGRPVVGACGPQWAKDFYDERLFRRHEAVPGFVLSTLFGHGAVHTLDKEAHRQRKRLFLTATGRASADRLVEETSRSWEEMSSRWRRGDEIMLHPTAAELLARAASKWADLTLTDREIRRTATDMMAMVDGFATLGRRHWRARMARRRQQRRTESTIEAVRRGAREALPGSPLETVVTHRQADGTPLPGRVAAVELINLIRPTVAVSWFVAYTGHALTSWPRERERLLSEDPEQIRAFVHEVRRWYPFAPFVGAIALTDLEWAGHRIAPGQLVLLDVYGQNHSAELWHHPERFDPERFVGAEIDPYSLIPQGGGAADTGHRCPGEDVTIRLLVALAPRLAALDYDVPTQDLSIPLKRLPSRVTSGVVLTRRT